MSAFSSVRFVIFFLLAAFAPAIGRAQTIIDADFFKGNFAALGWKVKGDWDVFEVHRCKATWAVQWAKVAAGAAPQDKTWATAEIDATHAAVRDGGGLSRLTITRDSDGSFTISDKDWNKGAGATVRFTDATTTSFSQLVLLGTRNFDEQVFNRIVLATGSRDAAVTTAIPASDFLNSIGVVTTFPDRGQPLPKTVEMIKYGGFRWVRGGIEGLSVKRSPVDRLDSA